MAPKVLVVLTSFGYIESAQRKTGWYLPEFAHPYEVLANKGVEITVASPKGGEAPLDPSSVEAFQGDASATNFLNTKKAVWTNTAKLSEVAAKGASEFDALFFPGGFGPMFDLATDPDSLALVAAFAAAGKPVAAVCHGPTALARATGPDGRPLLAGKRVTGFSNAEEEQTGLKPHLPYLLEDRLREAGGAYEKAAEVWAEHVAVDDGGKLITGQNPASSRAVGEALAKALNL